MSATNELDEHLNSAIKEKYALSTDITGIVLTRRVSLLYMELKLPFDVYRSYSRHILEYWERLFDMRN